MATRTCIRRVSVFLFTLLCAAVLFRAVPARAAGLLTVDSTNSPYTVSSDITYNYEYVGSSSQGIMDQSGYINTVNDLLILGPNPGTSGTYYLSGGSLASSSGEYVGYGGAGSFIQTGGSNTVTGNLYIDMLSLSGGAYYISGSGSTLAVSGNEYIGDSGTGTFTQSGGSNTVAGDLDLGYTTGGSGAYDLSGGSLSAGTVNLNTGNTFTQTGGSLTFTTFNQTGGTATFTDLALGAASGSSSTYNLSGGSAEISGNLDVGDGGSGSFTQSGGVLDPTDQIIGDSGAGSYTLSGGTDVVTSNLILGNQTTGSGTYTLSDSSGPALLQTGGSEYIGNSGTGTFVQTGGSNTVAGYFVLGESSGSSGTYDLSGSGSTLAVSGNEYIGDSGAGSFTQSGGKNTADFITLGRSSGSNGVYIQTGGSNDTAGMIGLGVASGSSGTYDLGGSGSMFAMSDIIGFSGTGTLSQTGGSNTDELYLDLGSESGSSGTYNLSGGSLAAGSGECVGDGGAGTFTQTGGSNTVTGDLILGNSSGSSGTYDLSGSGSTLAVSGGEFIGESGAGTFTQSGGSNTNLDGALMLGYASGSSGAYNQTGGFNAANALSLGLLSGSSGTYALSGGSLTSTYDEVVGFEGSGSFTQSGGSNMAQLDLILGNASGSSGVYDLSGSGSLLYVSNNEYVGYSGAGTFTQTGGANFIQNDLDLGYATGGSGAYDLSGGSLTAWTINLNPGSTFTQTGGSANFTDLVLGSASGSSSTYNLSGGDLTASIGEFVGRYGSGSFNQTGGSNTTGFLSLGNNKGSSSTYNLSGGSNTVSFLDLGGASGAIGTYNQTGGDDMAEALVLGFLSGSSGTYNLSGGSLASSFIETIGGGGAGTLNQTGGSNTVTGNLFLGYASGSSGDYALSGGTLQVTGNVYIGEGGSGSFTQSGGLLDPADEIIGDSGTGSYTLSGGTDVVTNNLILGNQTTGNGTYTLNDSNGPALLQTEGSEYIGNSGTGTFTQTGGSNAISGGLYVKNGSYNLDGGTLSVSGGGQVPAAAGSASYTQGKSGILQVNIASASNYGHVTVNGTASLAGTLNPVFENGYFPAGEQTLQILTASGGVSGKFSSYDGPTNFSPTVLDELLYTSDSVDIAGVRDYTNPGLNLTWNQHQVGNMLNDVSSTTTGDLGTILNNIDGLRTSGQVANAFQHMSPDMAASLANLGFAASDIFRQDLIERITNLRYGAENGGSLALGGGSLGFAGADTPLLAMGPSNPLALLGAGSAADGSHKFGGLNVYVDPLISWGTQNSTATEIGYDFSIGGFAAGADFRPRDDLLTGIATGYAYTDAGYAEFEGQANNATVPITLYAFYTPFSSFYAFGAAGYALNTFNMNRQIGFGGINRMASSSTTGNQFNTYGEAGYDFKLGKLVMTPVFDFSYSNLWIGGFTESGAGVLNLNVDSQHAESLQTGPGIKLGWLEQCGRAEIAPQFYVSYEHEYLNNSRDLEASLGQVGIPFAFATQQLGKNFAVIGGSLTLFSGKNFSVQLNSNAEVGRSDYAAYTLDAGLRFQF